MKNVKNTDGINPTPDFFANQHTEEFVKILPNTYMIKGAKNDRGFDQGYALQMRNKEEYVLIDVVERATKEAVEKLIHNGGKIRAILISGESVLKDVYADLQTISEDAGGADIYLHPKNTLKDDFETKNLTENDGLIKEFNLEIDDLPASKNGAALIYSNLNDGMLFTGDSAKGSAYDTDEQTFTRQKLENKSADFEMGENWITYERNFSYLFPRKGKPVIEIDGGTRSDILNMLRRGE